VLLGRHAVTGECETLRQERRLHNILNVSPEYSIRHMRCLPKHHLRRGAKGRTDKHGRHSGHTSPLFPLHCYQQRLKAASTAALRQADEVPLGGLTLYFRPWEQCPDERRVAASQALESVGGLCRGIGACISIIITRENMEKKPGVRERVLAAGVDLFAANGYDATSVAQIVEEAGVAKGGFYHHFSSKAELLNEVYGTLITEQVAEMDRIIAEGASLSETLRKLIVNLTESTAAKGKQGMVIWREMHRLNEPVTLRIRQARRRYHTTVVKLIRAGQRAGEFSRVASPEIITFMIFGVINELPIWYQPAGRKSPLQIGNELADFVLAALDPDRPKPPVARNGRRKSTNPA
jgi:AcrR family transcriptional regulator